MISCVYEFFIIESEPEPVKWVHSKVYLHEYHDLEDARQHIGRFLDEVYMHKRVHSALGYVPPAEYEVQWYAEHLHASR